ncbi:hypothetical protein TCAL_04790 [Tigriopus californicus]|uniref:GON-4-like protein n=1 Tax=Tigriopus californicus TaxID=6832 RepID=A0A553PS80_TIGCA|nr:hypothetical protein TCAL_04790 [Tigriopus californicus]
MTEREKDVLPALDLPIIISQGLMAAEKVTEADEAEEWSDIGSQEEVSPQGSGSAHSAHPATPTVASPTTANKAKNRRTKFSLTTKHRFKKLKRRRKVKPRRASAALSSATPSQPPPSLLSGEDPGLPAELAAATTGFDASLGRTARKLGLNRRQVKSVLKSVCSDATFLGMMREKAGEVVESGLRLESRVTRTKAKNLKEDGAKLDWVLEKMEAISKQTPKKHRIEEIPLGTVEFPEEDEPDDIEYDPKNDPEAVEEDDDESLAASSDIGTPNRSFTGGNPGGLLSPPSSSMSSFPSLCNTPGALVTPKVLDPTSTFKLPNPLIEGAEALETLSKSSSASRSLVFNDVEPEKAGCSRQNRTWLTRSKANLKHVPIEELETQFVPPDITPDMYDTHVDDYTLFLAETFYKPITPEPIIKNSEVAGGHTFDLEETDPDPDYTFQETDEHKNEERDEFKYDRSTKISKKEVDSLIHELITAYDLDQNDDSDEAKSRKKKQRIQGEEALLESYYLEMGPDSNQVDMAPEMMAVLSHQIKMHIQLLTQMTMLTSHEPKLHHLNFDCKKMTTDLVQAGMDNPKSILNPPSLFPSLNLVDQWEQLRVFPFDVDAFKKKKYPVELNPRLMNIMGESGVFQYPSLIPCQAISVLPNKRTNTFSDSEDYLIAIGVEEYYETMKKANKKITLKTACAEVVKKYCPGKTIKQVHTHIHNARRKTSTNKVLDHLNATGKALVPEMDYDQLAAVPLGVPLRQAPPLSLPEIWRQFFCLRLPEEVKPSPPPKKQVLPAVDGVVQAIFDPQSQTIAVQIPKDISTEVVSTFQIPDAAEKRKTSPRKYRPILPKGSGSSLGLKSLQASQSPLKKERERILRKYSPLKKARVIRPKGTAPNKAKEADPMPLVAVAGAVAEPSFDMSMPEIVELPKEAKENIAPLNNEETEEGEEPLAERLVLDSQPETSSEPVERVEQAEQTKKKTKQQREAEILAYILAEETVEEVNARREREAFDIFKFAERDLDPLEFTEFLGLLTTLEQDILKGFTDLHHLLKGHVEIQEMLLDLLTPESAIKLGQPVYSSFLTRNRHKEFFRKLRRAYEHTPSSHTRILKDMANFLSDPQMDQTTLTNMASKLFRGNPHLHDLFLSLLPNSPVLDSRLPKPEVINLVDLENEMDGDENMAQAPDGAEKVSLVGDLLKDEYGGDKCPCACHAFSAEDDRSAHCLHCSIRFLNGKIYRREGKVLKPVRVEFPPGCNPYAKGNKSSPNSRKKTAKKASSEAGNSITNAESVASAATETT